MRHVADPAGTVIRAVLDRQLVDRGGLDVVEHLAGLGVGELVVGRAACGGHLDELPRRLLEHDRRYTARGP